MAGLFAWQRVTTRGLFDALLAQQSPFQAGVSRLGAQPDAEHGLVELRLGEFRRLGLVVDAEHHAFAGYPVQGELVAGLEFLVAAEDLAHAQHTGHQLGELLLVQVVLHAVGKQLAQLRGIDGAQHAHGHALGALQRGNFVQ